MAERATGQVNSNIVADIMDFKADIELEMEVMRLMILTASPI